MAEAGSIKYTIEADTSELLKAENVVDKSTKSIADDFIKVDKEVSKSTKSINKDLVSVEKTATKTGMTQTKVSKSVTNSFKLQKGASQQLGYQLQDMAVQAQMGISPFVILGQQGSQLAGVLGPGGALLGAVIAISSALGGVLFKALGGASLGTEDLTEKLRELIKTTTLTAEQAQVLIDAEVKTSTETAKTIAEISKKIKTTELAIKASDGLIERTDKESKHLKKIVKGNLELRKELDLQIATRQTLVGEIERSNEKMELYNTLTGDKSVKATKAQKDTIDEMIKSLKLQSESLGKTEKDIALSIASQLKATDTQKAAINSHYDSINAYNDEQDAIIDTMNMIEEFTKFEADAAKERASLKKQVDVTGVDTLTALQNRQDAENQIIKDGLDAQLIDHADAMTRREEIDNRYDELRLAAIEKRFIAESEANAFLMSSLDALGSSATSALSGMLTGTQSVGDAMKSLGMTIVNQVIGSLVQAGIETVKNTILSQSLETAKQTGMVATQGVNAATTAAGTATQVAAAGTVATAAAPAAALTSTFSFGTAALIGGAAVLGTMALVQAASGGREHGGPVKGGSLYEVGEGGNPEIFSSGGRNFMIPGNDGEVTSNKDAFGSGGGASVVNNINFVTDPNVSVEQSASSQNSSGGQDAEFIIRVVAGDLSRQGSQTNRALKGSTNTTSRIGGNRRS